MARFRLEALALSLSDSSVPADVLLRDEPEDEEEEDDRNEDDDDDDGDSDGYSE